MMAQAAASELLYTWRAALPRCYTAGRTRPVESILLHSSCGREAADLEVLTGRTTRRVSVHWYVARSGRIWHLVADGDTAWHAGRVRCSRWSNAASVGIELEHFDPDRYHPRGEDWPAAQVAACARLCAWLLARHGLSVTDVVSHAKAAHPPGRKTDPYGYPWPAFRDAVTVHAAHLGQPDGASAPRPEA